MGGCGDWGAQTRWHSARCFLFDPRAVVYPLLSISHSNVVSRFVGVNSREYCRPHAWHFHPPAGPTTPMMCPPCVGDFLNTSCLANVLFLCGVVCLYCVGDAGQLGGWLAGWLAGCPWLLGWLAGWLIGCRAGKVARQPACHPVKQPAATADSRLASQPASQPAKHCQSVT